MRYLFLTALLTLSGCVAQVDYEYDPSEEQTYLERTLGLPPADTTDILGLTPDMVALLDERINPNWSGRQKLKALRELFFNENELNIRYDATNTLTAAETFAKGRGNCLSLTTLTVAAARHIGLKAYYQTVEVKPTWDHEGETMIRYEHIVATGQMVGGGIWVIDFLPDFVIGDSRNDVISDREALALYYNNRGAEELVSGDHDRAIGYLQHALHIDADLSDAWNNMGAAMRRSGQYDLAEFSYKRAIQEDGTNLSALSNLSRFYSGQGRRAESEQFQQMVDRYRRKNPYFHYFLAQLFFDEGDYLQAQEFLKRSIKLKRDEPDFYVAMAKTHHELGNSNESKEMLSLADKYRTGLLRAPTRSNNHRFWNMTIEVNPRLMDHEN